MEIFLDTADLKEIKRWLDMGLCDGVTTNPSIMVRNEVYDFEKGAKEIASLIHPRPLSVEVTTNNLDEMIEQARHFASLAPNIVIKIPQLNEYGEPCYGVIKRLEEGGIKVNATVAMSFGQVICAAKAGATYISIFAGRIGDEGGDAAEVIRNSVNWLRLWNYKSKIIVGSIRSVADVQSAILAGAHIITIPPDIMRRLVDHKYTRSTVAQFIADARKAYEMAEKLKGP